MSNSKYSQTYRLRLIAILGFIFLGLLSYLSDASVHYPYGDGTEYVCMNEAWVNHGDPGLKAKDVDGYRNYLSSHGLELYNANRFNELHDLFLAHENNTLSEFQAETLVKYGFFTAPNGEIYPYHFSFYSLINAPARIVLEHLEADIRITFLATNLFLLIIALYVIFTTPKLNIWEQLGVSALLIFSPMIWYIDWAHPDAYAGILCFLGGFLFLNKGYYKALLAFSLAAIHFQPLFIPALFIFLNLLKRDGFKPQTLVKLFFASFWIVIGPLFYLYHFGKASLIFGTGYVSTEVLSLKRMYSFYFDVNQGMLIGIPLILILVIGFLIWRIVKRKFIPSYWGLLVVMLMSYFFLQMTTWNHGNAVVNRYVVWTAPFFILIFLEELKQLKLPWKIPLLLLAISTQVWAILAQQDWSIINWHSSDHNKLAKYLMRNYPDLYNPDPQIFMWRKNKFMLSSSDSVAVFTDKNDNITKMLFQEKSLGQLIQRGVKPEELEAYKSKLSYYNGYAYINASDLERLGYDQSKDTLIQRIEKDKIGQLKWHFRSEIYNDANWLNKIKSQGDALGISLDSAVTLNVDYIINERSKTRHD